MEHVERTVTLPTDPTEAWDLLTDPDELSRWLGDEVALTPAPGASGRVVERDGTDRTLVVEEVDEGRRLSWRWWRTGDDPDAAGSRVDVTLAPADGGTLVRVIERPLPSATSAVASVRDGLGWSHRLLHLELLVLLAAAAAGAATR